MDGRLLAAGIAVAVALTLTDIVLRLRARHDTPRRSPADLTITAAATLTTLGLAGIAGAVSYDHLRELAESRGETGWRAHAFPLTVDGVEIVATLTILADRRASRPSTWVTWTALVAGGIASLGANILVAQDDLIARIIAGWPAIALIAAIKMLSGILEHAPRHNTPPDRHPPASSITRTAEPADGLDDAPSENVSRQEPPAAPDDPAVSRLDDIDGDTAAADDWPVTLMRRIPVNPEPYQRWQAVWADLKAGNTDLKDLARRHHFDVRSVQAIRRAGQLGILDHPDPPARRLAALPTATGHHEPPPPPPTDAQPASP
ncbi:DUF2637 domain-containing protein [Micromonospora sediminimaris]|uniref:DUF2637 domain-containing protein n=1 Tax=Micromonospora sediminimaris TaxID=547162 RepID=A0A9W5UTX0_9ACTN|nr:DUF2637 domain-containing protein [Micromonospora sediminimaris]GIJ34981.1 hypothetical protein Vse01_41290 [Micromonospora sediminimaris]SFD29058.1 Protein of unknown function [Micromonospora sediminimaris]